LQNSTVAQTNYLSLGTLHNSSKLLLQCDFKRDIMQLHRKKTVKLNKKKLATAQKEISVPFRFAGTKR